MRGCRRAPSCCPAAPPSLPSFPQPCTEAEALLLRPCAVPGPAHHWAGHAGCRRAGHREWWGEDTTVRIPAPFTLHNERQLPCGSLIKCSGPGGWLYAAPTDLGAERVRVPLYTGQGVCRQQGHRHCVLDTQPLGQLCTRGHPCPIAAALTSWTHSQGALPHSCTCVSPHMGSHRAHASRVQCVFMSQD